MNNNNNYTTSVQYIIEHPQGENQDYIIKIDTLGRIMIPKDVREELEIEDNQALMVFFDENALIVKADNYGYEDCSCEWRKVDIFGRIVLPKAMREELEMSAGDHLLAYITDDGEFVIEKGATQ